MSVLALTFSRYASVKTPFTYMPIAGRFDSQSTASEPRPMWTSLNWFPVNSGFISLTAKRATSPPSSGTVGSATIEPFSSTGSISKMSPSALAYAALGAARAAIASVTAAAMFFIVFISCLLSVCIILNCLA